MSNPTSFETKQADGCGAPNGQPRSEIARVRRVMQREAASDFLSSVVERVGPVDVAGEVPRNLPVTLVSFQRPTDVGGSCDDNCAVLGWLSARAVKLPPRAGSNSGSVAHRMARVVRYDTILGREFKGRFRRVDAQAGIREAQVGSACQW